jgi:hypothetical protein
MAAKTTREFVEFLLKDTTHPVWISSLPNEKGTLEVGERHVLSRDSERLLQFCDKWDVAGRALYYCVSTINGHRRTIETAAEIKFLFADIDYKDFTQTPKEILKAIRGLKIPPSRIHHSGNGLHVLWSLDKAVPADDHVAKLLKQLCNHVGGDLHPTHIAAFLRMPGTHNSKFNQWKPVTVTLLPGKPVGIEEFQAWMGSSPKPALLKKDAPTPESAAYLKFSNETGFKPPIDVDARLAQMEYKGAGDKGVHATQIAVGASLLARGEHFDDIVDRIMEATERVAGPNWNMNRERQAVEKSLRTAIKKGIGPRSRAKPNPQKTRPEPPKAQHKANGNLANKSENLANKGNGMASPLDHDTRDEDEGAEILSFGSAAAAKALKEPKLKPADYAHILAKAVLDIVLGENEEQIRYTKNCLWHYAKGIWSLQEDENRCLNELVERACIRLKIQSTNTLSAKRVDYWRAILPYATTR